MTIFRTAVQIVEAMSEVPLLFLADDEQQAESVALAAAAIAPRHAVIYLPSSDALPGDDAPASPANIGRRVAALRALRRARTARQPVACIASGEAAGQLYAAPTAFDAVPPRLALGNRIEPEAVRATLSEAGYSEDDRVDEPGEMAVRGEVIDIFPADAGLPVRLEISDGQISAIRSYDPITQRTTVDRTHVEVGRAAEPPRSDGTSILSHLSAGQIVFAPKADRRRVRYLTLAQDAADRRSRTLDAVDEKSWQAALAGWSQRDLGNVATDDVPRFAETRQPLASFARFSRPHLESGKRLVLIGSDRDLRFLKPRLAHRLGVSFGSPGDWDGIGALPPGKAGAISAPADRGFIDETRLVIAAADLLGSRAIVEHIASVPADALAVTSGDIRIGDVVIHEDHGVAVVVNLETAAADDGESIVLEFSGSARRLVPTGQAGRIWRYGADRDAVALDRLDGASWPQRRDTIMAAIAESAQRLSDLAAARSKTQADALVPDPAAYERFVAGFTFSETADQIRAIEAVRTDLASGRPMDRLVIGDVGYGKTEIALRAAALAALAGHQVIVAAPTTVLVRQHIDTFRHRFAATGLGVEGLSRLSTAADRKRVKAGLADGSVAIVIGTGAVVGKDVRYARLGLVIIDEEQRFGAADKARLRGDGERHLLTLSATPIPRTLQMAMIGVRDVSLIVTPPARRQPVRTRLETFDPHRVRTAILREKQRGGQSFAVVPRIEDMPGLKESLERALPDIAIVEAHGRMPPAEIDRVMVEFAGGTGDLLLATNIIEAGLDVPRANTMLIWRADRFGLAQLHQLRGRVGRGGRRGQILLLTDSDGAIADRTLKRLRTLAAFDQLGAGFQISRHDLDQRGGGDLLGEAQAGHSKLIGADLYQHLFASALRTARGEPAEPDDPELRIGTAGQLPETWIPDQDIRLGLYVRLARIGRETDLDAFEEELDDRFGPPPPPAQTLLFRTRIRLAARAARVARVDAGPAAIALTPGPGFTADTSSHDLEEKGGRLILRFEGPDDVDVTARCLALLDSLVGG